MTSFADKLIANCAEMFDVHPRDLRGHYRFGFLTKPRFALYAALRQRGWSQGQIGRELNRDRTTVRHGLERAAYYMEQDADFAEKVHALSEGLEPRAWVASPIDVFEFVCAAWGEHPNVVRRTMDFNARSDALMSTAARVAADAGMSDADIASALGRTGLPQRYLSRWASIGEAEDLRIRATAQFQPKGIAIQDCA